MAGAGGGGVGLCEYVASEMCDDGCQWELSDYGDTVGDRLYGDGEQERVLPGAEPYEEYHVEHDGQLCDFAGCDDYGVQFEQDCLLYTSDAADE